MTERKQFLTLGRTKTEKVIGFFILIFLFYKALDLSGILPTIEETKDAIVNETYHELTIPKIWFKDYSKERMVKLLKEFESTNLYRKVTSELSKLKQKPEISVEIYQDKIESQKELGWIIRFSVATHSLSHKKSQEIASFIGGAFGEYIEKYRK